MKKPKNIGGKFH